MHKQVRIERAAILLRPSRASLPTNFVESFRCIPRKCVPSWDFRKLHLYFFSPFSRTFPEFYHILLPSIFLSLEKSQYLSSFNVYKQTRKWYCFSLAKWSFFLRDISEITLHAKVLSYNTALKMGALFHKLLKFVTEIWRFESLLLKI